MASPALNRPARGHVHTEALLLHDNESFGPVLWSLSAPLVSAITKQSRSLEHRSNNEDLEPFDILLFTGNWTEINFTSCQAGMHAYLFYITDRIIQAKRLPESAQADRKALRWRRIKALSLRINPRFEEQRVAYYDPRNAYMDEVPQSCESWKKLPYYISMLLVLLSPLHYVSLDCRHMTRTQQEILQSYITSSTFEHHVEIRLLRLACSDSIARDFIYHINLDALQGLHIDTGLERAAYRYAARRLGQTLKRLVIRLTSVEANVEEPLKPDEYDRAFFPITSGTLAKILDNFPNLAWLTIDVATSIEESYTMDLGDENLSDEPMIHPRVETTISHITRVLNRAESLHRLALTWRGTRPDFVMGPGSVLGGPRTATFGKLIKAIAHACPQLHRIAFVVEYMFYYLGLRQNDGSMLTGISCMTMVRPGEWPMGLRCSRDYFEVAEQQPAPGDKAGTVDKEVEMKDSAPGNNERSEDESMEPSHGDSNQEESKSDVVSDRGGNSDGKKTQTALQTAEAIGSAIHEPLAQERLNALRKILRQSMAEGIFNLQVYEDNLLAKLHLANVGSERVRQTHEFQQMGLGMLRDRQTSNVDKMPSMERFEGVGVPRSGQMKYVHEMNIKRDDKKEKEDQGVTIHSSPAA